MKLPLGWKRLALADVADFLDQKRVPLEKKERANLSGSYPYYGASGVIDHVVDFIFDGDFVLLAEDGANIINRSTPIAFKASGKFWVNNHAHVLKPKDGIDHDFLVEQLESLNFERFNTGTTQPKLNRQTCEQIPVVVPPTKVQKRIGDLAVIWDAAIEKIERLNAAKEQIYSDLIRRLIVSRASLDTSWKHLPIHEIADRIQEQTDGGNYPLLTISSASGFIRQEDKYRRHMAGESAKTYTLLRAGEFSYNKGNSLRYEFGCIFQLQGHESALVPSVYVSFKLRDSVCAAYMRHLFAADYLKPQLRALVKTGVRNNGLLNIRPDEFMGTTVPIPPLAEQEKISKVLDSARLEIANLSKQLVALRKQKRGLMQKLLTGQWRIKVAEAEAPQP